jgi:hypothetical protein
VGYRLDNFHVLAIMGPYEYGTPFRRAAAAAWWSAHRCQYRTQQPVHRTTVDGLCFTRRWGQVGKGVARAENVTSDSAMRMSRGGYTDSAKGAINHVTPININDPTIVC